MSNINTDDNILLEVLNNKVDRDFNNVNPSDTARKEIMRWGIPDYSRGVSIQTPYTMPYDGYVLIVRGGGKSLVSLYVDGVLVGSNNSNTSNEGGSITCFAAKESVVTWGDNGNVTNRIVFPLRGS